MIRAHPLLAYVTWSVGLVCTVTTATVATAQDDAFPDLRAAMTESLAPPEGTFTFGIFYSEAERASASVQIDQDRIAGRDDNLRFGVEVSEFSQSSFVTLTDPDFFGGPYARQLAFSIRSAQPNATQRGDYTFTAAEASIGFARTWSETLSYSFGTGLTKHWLDNDDALPQFIADYTAETGEETTDIFVYGNAIQDWTAQDGWQRSGTRLRLRTQLGIAEGTGYLRALIGAEQFLPLGRRTELRIHGALGLAGTLSNGPYPIFRNFTGGGPGSVRGFSTGTLGPSSLIPGEPEPAYPGGQFSLVTGLEARTPLGGRDDLFGLGFLDLGNIHARPDDFTADELRRSVGFGVQWESPIGPFSIFFAEPIDPEAGDEISRLQFLFGLRR